MGFPRYRQGLCAAGAWAVFLLSGCGKQVSQRGEASSPAGAPVDTPAVIAKVATIPKPIAAPKPVSSPIPAAPIATPKPELPAAEPWQVASVVRVRIAFGGVAPRDSIGALLALKELPYKAFTDGNDRFVLTPLKGWDERQLRSTGAHLIVYRNETNDDGEPVCNAFAARLVQFDQATKVGVLVYTDRFPYSQDVGFELDRNDLTHGTALLIRTSKASGPEPVPAIVRGPYGIQPASAAAAFPVSTGIYSGTSSTERMTVVAEADTEMDPDSVALNTEGKLAGFVDDGTKSGALLTSLDHFSIRAQFREFAPSNVSFEDVQPLSQVRMNLVLTGSGGGPLPNHFWIRKRRLPMNGSTEFDTPNGAGEFDPISDDAVALERTRVYGADTHWSVMLPRPVKDSRERYALQVCWPLLEDGTSPDLCGKPFELTFESNAEGIFPRFGGLPQIASSTEPEAAGIPTPFATPFPTPFQPVSPGVVPGVSASEEDRAISQLIKSYEDSLVFVAGTTAAGSGFIATFGKSNFLITNIHVVAGVENATFKTLHGEQVQWGQSSMAVGEDIFATTVGPVTKPLEVMQEVDRNASVGDAVAVLGNAEGQGVINSIKGRLIGIGPNLVEVDAPFVPGNSGSPIIHLKTGKVIGVATYVEVKSHDISTGLALNQPSIRRFGYRLDTIKGWQTVDWRVFASQSAKTDQISALTVELLETLHELYTGGGVTSAHLTNTGLKSAVESWQEAGASGAGDADLAEADAIFFSDLKKIAKSDIDAARKQVTYDYFEREISDNERLREELMKTLPTVVQSLKIQRQAQKQNRHR